MILPILRIDGNDKLTVEIYDPEDEDESPVLTLSTTDKDEMADMAGIWFNLIQTHQTAYDCGYIDAVDELCTTLLNCIDANYTMDDLRDTIESLLSDGDEGEP